VEVRQSVSVKSQNYRIELSAAGNQPYPAGGPPIGVFLRTGNRRFLYRLVMPADSAYQTVSGILAALWTGASGRMRRITLSAADLRQRWPKAPL
jgi:hypothetical protein